MNRLTKLRAALKRTTARIKSDRKRADKLRAEIKREQTKPAGRIIPREEWGAKSPNGSYTPQVAFMAGVQHHTANPTLPANATVKQESERMRQIQSAHLAQGWTDIGYALVCFPSGRIYEGRPAKYVGAHTLNYNTGYAGWSLDGNYEEARPTAAAIAACRRCRVVLGVENKPLYGHYQLGPTACPGKNLKPFLNKEI